MVNKKILSIEVAVILGVSGMNVQASALSHGDLLTIAPGSWFAVDFDDDQLITPSEQVGITPGSDGGIIIGLNQAVGDIDTWSVISLPGSHYTPTTPVTGDTTNGLDFSGWEIFWDGALIPNGAGYGAWAPSNCAVLGCNGLTFSTGIANFIWSGVYGDAYELWFSWGSLSGAALPLTQGDSSTSSIPNNLLYLEGTVLAPSSVPIPSAAWLFGSGLLGLIGVARRKKAQRLNVGH